MVDNVLLHSHYLYLLNSSNHGLRVHIVVDFPRVILFNFE